MRMELAPRSSTSNQNYLQDAWIEMNSLPSYNEIHNHPGRAISAEFDQVSLPSYEAAVNSSIRRADTSVTIPEALILERGSNPLQFDSNCCGSIQIRQQTKHKICAIVCMTVAIIFCIVVILILILYS